MFELLDFTICIVISWVLFMLAIIAVSSLLDIETGSYIDNAVGVWFVINCMLSVVGVIGWMYSGLSYLVL